MAAINKQSLDQSRLECDTCGAKSCCIGEGLTNEQLQGLKKITTNHGPFQPGQAIFKMEDSFKSLFVIQSGTVKIETVSPEGSNLVDGFFFKGDLIGMEAIGGEQYLHDAIALEETWVCELPFDHVESLCSFIPRLQHKLLILLGQKIRHMNETFLHGRYLSAEQRLLLFFQMLCHKNVITKNGPSRSLTLPMPKGDIASYLGLRAESLSRALGKLQSDGIIFNRGRTIEFLDIDAVLKLACK